MLNSGIILKTFIHEGMRFHEILMPYLLFLKKQQNLKLSSAANYRWRFMGYGSGWMLIPQIRPQALLTVYVNPFLREYSC